MLPGEKGNKQTYPDLNSMSYSHDWNAKILLPLMQQGEALTMRGANLVEAGFKAHSNQMKFILSIPNWANTPWLAKS